MALNQAQYLKLLNKAILGKLSETALSRVNEPHRAALKRVNDRAIKAGTGASKSTGDLANGAKSLYSALTMATGGATEFEKGLEGVAKAALISFKSLNKVNSLSGLTTKSFQTLSRVTKSLIEAFAGTTDKIEKYRIGLNKSGVDGRKFILELRRQQDALSSYNVTFKTLNSAFTDFQDNLAGVLSKGYPQQREALLKIAAVNEKFGIDIGTSTRFINQLDTGLQQTAAQTDVFSRRLQKFALDTGQPVKKVFNDFTAAAGEFFVELDPDKALRKFTVFQQVARRLGTEVSNLTRLTDQFETIEGGMEFGGKLNMLISNLGGSFDSTQAILMSQPERMEYIAKQVGQVGNKIRGMSDLGQRAILKELAGTLGVDVGMVRSLLNKDKSADIQRFISGTTSLSAMNTTEQARLAREMTTRDDKKTITDEQLMGKFTIAVETLTQSTTDAKQVIIRGTQRTMFKKLDKFTPVLDKTATAISSFALEANTNNKDMKQIIVQFMNAVENQGVQTNALTKALKNRGVYPTPTGTPSTPTAQRPPKRKDWVTQASG